MIDDEWAPVIPELVVTDFGTSLAFWTDVLDFSIMYQRREPDFVMLRLGRAQIMIEAANESSWLTGALVRPFGRGINLQIDHPDPAALAARLDQLGVVPYRDLRETHYDVDGVDVVQLAVVIQDPDGYLVRFARDSSAR